MKVKRHPIRTLTAQIRKHRAFSLKNFPRIAAFYSKLIIQEPFRIWESITCAEKIRNHAVTDDPVFIIGHWRSGTSFLQYLLGRDPQFGYMNKFEVVFPDVFLKSERLLKEMLESIPRTLNIIRDAENMSVNLDLDSPSEIEIALTTMISPTSLHWGHIFPNDGWEYFNKYLFFDTASANEVRLWKRHYRHLIRKTSLKNEGRQLLIKSPGNSCRINKLLELYPDARFIFIHRNPYDVFYSSKKLWNTLLNNLSLQQFTEIEIERAIIRIYKNMMSRYLEQRNMIPDHQLAELRFEDFISKPVEKLETVYEYLQLDGFDDAKPAFNNFLEHKAEGKSSNYDYENRVLSLINKNWDFTFNEWQYQMLETSEYTRV